MTQLAGSTRHPQHAEALQLASTHLSRSRTRLGRAGVTGTPPSPRLFREPTKTPTAAPHGTSAPERTPSPNAPATATAGLRLRLRLQPPAVAQRRSMPAEQQTTPLARPTATAGRNTPEATACRPWPNCNRPKARPDCNFTRSRPDCDFARLWPGCDSLGPGAATTSSGPGPGSPPGGPQVAQLAAFQAPNLHQSVVDIRRLGLIFAAPTNQTSGPAEFAHDRGHHPEDGAASDLARPLHHTNKDPPQRHQDTRITKPSSPHARYASHDRHVSFHGTIPSA